MRAGPVPPSTARAPAAAPPAVETLFAGMFGLLLGVGLLKFGNPVILDRLVELPRNLDEWRAFAWPIRIGQLGLVLTLLAGLPLVRRSLVPRAPVTLVALLAGWLAWQLVASVASIDPALTRVVVPHFACCAACWALGHYALARVSEPRVFWLCLVLGFVGVLGMALDQRFGGLEATRKMILESPDAARLPPEYLARIRSHRVFSTLVYPNALAGSILLLLAPSVVLAARLGDRWGPAGRRTACALLLAAGLAVLVWSGSKAGWLLAMGAGLVLLFLGPWDRRWKIGIAVAFLFAGLLGFGLLFGERLSRGATSVSARFDYWQAGLHGVSQRPVLGNGPGAFKKIYASVKRPESEMAQLAHNDYLQQAVDSGLPGFLTYAGFVIGSLAWLYRQRRRLTDPLAAAVGLGLATWFAQGLVEFGLYIPATAWAAFALLGWLMAQPGHPEAADSFRPPPKTT